MMLCSSVRWQSTPPPGSTPQTDSVWWSIDVSKFAGNTEHWWQRPLNELIGKVGTVTTEDSTVALSLLLGLTNVNLIFRALYSADNTTHMLNPTIVSRALVWTHFVIPGMGRCVQTVCYMFTVSGIIVRHHEQCVVCKQPHKQNMKDHEMVFRCDI